MKVLIPKYSGFCPGVKKAEERLFEEKKNVKNPIYIYGQLIHNSHYIDFLEKEGLKTLEKLEDIPLHEKIVIRTHGISKQIEEKIAENYQVFDLTCYTVKKLQLKIKEFSDGGYFLILTGKKDHPEVQGLISYAKDYVVIEKESEIKAVLNEMSGLLDSKKYRKLLAASQTTGEQLLFELVTKAIKEKLSPLYEIAVLNSICPITSLREKEALNLQKKVDITFVIGDKKSSNAKKIFEVLKQADLNTYFVEDLKSLKNLNLPLLNYKKAQVVSSSSTPDFIESEIVGYLSSI